MIEPTAVAFHPAFTVLGSQPSVMVGLKGGVVMKQNTADTRYVIHGECLVPPAPSSLDGDSAIDADVEGKRSTMQKMMGQAADATAVATKVTDENVVIPSQEFFVNHKSRIVMLGNYRKTTTVVSLDMNGVVNVWPYEPFAYTGFGWFIPSQHSCVDLTSATYTPKQGAKLSVIFPPEGLKAVKTASSSRAFSFVGVRAGGSHSRAGMLRLRRRPRSTRC